MNALWAVGAVLLFLGIEFDTFSTVRFIRIIGIEYEGNPLQRKIFRKWGRKGFAVFDSLGWLGFSILALTVPPLLAFVVLTIEACFFTFSAIRNILVTNKIRSKP